MSTALSAPQQQLTVPPVEQAPNADWKQLLAERLGSYRAKHSEASDAAPLALHSSTNSRASKIARTVASRYAAAPTYSELLLADAQAQQALLAKQAAQAEEAAEIAEQERLAAVADSSASLSPSRSVSPGIDSSISSAPTQPAKPVMPHFAARSREMHLHHVAQEPEPSLEDLLASSLVEPRSLLPSKLIEFPRELVASHRARPHLPENCGREQNPPAEPETSQLRIFEVQSEAEPTTRQSEMIAPSEAAQAPADAQSASRSSVGASSENPPEKTLWNHAQDTTARIPSPVPTASTVETASSIAAATLDATPARSAPQTSIPVAEASGTQAHRELPSRATATVRDTASLPDRQQNFSTVRAFKGLEWAAISLDKEPATYRKQETSVSEYVPFLVEPASIDRRVMAFAVDFAAVSAGFLGFLVVFAASTPHLPTGLTAAVLAGAVYASLWALYQFLFFSLSGATAGMLYARIALCTFDDQNPTRSALRRRLAAWWLSCLPLGLGLLWCFVDEDNLCWHDRMTRMYQRVY